MGADDNGPSILQTKDWRVDKNVHLQNTGDKQHVPIILTSLMASRAGTDIDKTLRRADIKGTEETHRVIMLRIVPVSSPDHFVSKDIYDAFRLDLSFLVHQVDLHMFQCDHNEKQIRDYVMN